LSASENRRAGKMKKERGKFSDADKADSKDLK
jgi:hypothetical protein